MQTKQHAMKNPHSYSNRNKVYKGLYFGGGSILPENVKNLQFCLSNKLELYSI